MKKISFVAIAGFVGWVISSFFPSVPGLDDTLIFIGTVAATSGAALGMLVKPLKLHWLILFVFASLAFCALGTSLFIKILSGEPGQTATFLLINISLLMFLPLGFIIEIVGIKVTSSEIET
ncbi:hypothetical protein [Roseibium sp.]|uniref:hypothetical protein n=1 Tax=Roseibium sp. TaxID=1936156 RepID=UPI003B522500